MDYKCPTLFYILFSQNCLGKATQNLFNQVVQQWLTTYKILFKVAKKFEIHCSYALEID